MKIWPGLHRSGTKAQWATVSAGRRNAWQRLAARSAGLITPANVVTVAGFGLVLTGLVYALRHDYASAVVLLIIGRLCDIADGWLAELTGTKSPVGELLDSTTDKLETMVALVSLVIAGIVPWLAALLVALSQIAVGATALAAWRHGRRIHPSRIGKYAMVLAWCGLGLFVLLKAVYLVTPAVASLAATGLCTLSALLSVRVAGSYRRVLFAVDNHHRR